MCEQIEPGRPGHDHNAGYDDRFVHRTGHGIGVRIEAIVTATEGGGQRLNNTARGFRVVA